jgi:hypothetical protein
MSHEPPFTIGIPPRFCPECGRAARESSGGAVCDHCGATLAIQGYCPICEARLRQPVGEPCPKHDVKLLADEPDGLEPTATGSMISWVTVRRFPDSLSASGARIRLDAEGIPTFLEGERMGAPSMYRVATGGVKLQVPAEFAADARIILSQDWSWPVDELETDDGPETDHEDIAPPPEGSPRAWLIELCVVLALAIPLLAALLLHLRGD